jgi:hypothetical protein
MLYLGIDQHKSQLTVNLRDEDGSVITTRLPFGSKASRAISPMACSIAEF